MRVFSVAGVHSVEVPSVADLWASVVRTSAPVALLRRRVGGAWLELSARIERRLQAELGAGPLQSTAIAYLGVGVK